MKYILGLALIATVIPGGWMACKSVEELDNCAYEISFLENRALKVPSNDGEVQTMCGKAKGGIKCLKDQAQECMQGPMKSVTIKVMGDLENHLNTRCDSPPHRADFLKHVQCFTDDAKAEAIRLCSDKHMVMMEKVSNMNKDLRLGGSCCTAHAMRECIVGKVNELCSGETGDYFNDMIQEVTEENIQIVCNEYGSLEQCDSKYDAAAWGQLKAIMASSDVSAMRNHKYKTVIPIIIKMMKETRRK